MIATDDLTALRLEAPNRLYRGDLTAIVGNTVVHALRTLIAAGGRAPVRAVCAAVWGGDEINKNTVYSLCERTSHALRAVGSPLRCGCEGGDVVLF